MVYSYPICIRATLHILIVTENISALSMGTLGAHYCEILGRVPPSEFLCYLAHTLLLPLLLSQQRRNCAPRQLNPPVPHPPSSYMHGPGGNDPAGQEVEASELKMSMDEALSAQRQADSREKEQRSYWQVKQRLCPSPWRPVALSVLFLEPRSRIHAVTTICILLFQLFRGTGITSS